MSFIYDEIDLSQEELENLGYYTTKVKDFKTIVPGLNQSYFFEKERPLTNKTLIVYYPGAFSYMHIGHLKLIKEAYNSLISDDVRIVISPANSDYLYDKYGSNVDVTNIQRFNRIVDFIEGHRDLLGGLIEDIIIDMNPMLNMTCDYNFTDLLKNFIDVSGLDYTQIPTPYILCGKDREYFKNLTNYTEKLKVFFYTGSDVSSRNFVEEMGTFTRKDVLVRVHSIEQYDIFKRYMFPFYNTINMYLISDEIKDVESYLSLKPSEPIYTNCKDYICTGLKYIPISRSFKHPLDKQPTVICKEGIPENSLIIDSDIFSGTTQSFVGSFNSKIIAIHNYKHETHTKDIVDIDDIIREDFNYPHVDVSERIGVQIFTTELHNVFNNLKKELRGITHD